jgi:hypothetical protein
MNVGGDDGDEGCEIVVLNDEADFLHGPWLLWCDANN